MAASDEQMSFARQRKPKTEAEAAALDHAFWDSQPVPKLNAVITENGPIEAPKPLPDVQQTPYPLLDQFEWTETDVTDAAVMKEVYTLLNLNYVEDEDGMFRFDYSPELLDWALKPPGWRKDWHIGVRVKSNRKLVAFIAAMPVLMRVYDKEAKMVEINFLCVHRRLRSHRLAPILIQEITRRVHLTDTWQAVYTAGLVLPKPVSQCRYYHRSLNPKKLVDVGFSALGPRMTMPRAQRLYRVPDAHQTAGLRPLVAADIPQVHALLTTYLRSFGLSPVFTEEELRYYLVPRPNVIYACVVETAGKITDMFSYYSLPSSVLRHPTHKTLNAAYQFYCVATSVSLTQLMTEALISAHANNFDVFNALDLQKNSEFLSTLKFGRGDGNLSYYLYNWQCPSMTHDQVGLILM